MSRALKVYAGSKGKWDGSRNTSRVVPVPRGEGLRVATMLAERSHEEWYRWIADVWAPTRGSLSRT